MSDIFRDYSFGGWLKSFRLKREKTLRDMCRAICVDPGNYSKLERSQLPPPNSPDLILKIRDALVLEEAEFEMLISAAYNYHLSNFRRKWER